MTKQFEYTLNIGSGGVFATSKNPHSKLWGIQGDFYSRKWVAASCGVLDPFSLNKRQACRNGFVFHPRIYSITYCIAYCIIDNLKCRGGAAAGVMNVDGSRPEQVSHDLYPFQTRDCFWTDAFLNKQRF